VPRLTFRRVAVTIYLRTIDGWSPSVGRPGADPVGRGSGQV